MPSTLEAIQESIIYQWEGEAVLGNGLLNPWLDLSMLALSGLLFLWPSVKMHQRARVLGVSPRNVRKNPLRKGVGEVKWVPDPDALSDKSRRKEIVLR
jgi:hypothetical protein